MSHFRICNVINDRTCDLQDSSGNVHHTTITVNHLLVPAEYIFSLPPDAKAYGRACKYINDLSVMPDLKWTDPATIIGQNILRK